MFKHLSSLLGSVARAGHLDAPVPGRGCGCLDIWIPGGMGVGPRHLDTSVPRRLRAWALWEADFLE